MRVLISDRIRMLVRPMWFVFPVLPLIVTLSVFPVLFNNLYNGPLIIALMILVNAGILLLPAGWFTHRVELRRAKSISLCTVSAMVAVLIVEASFPVVLPKEHAQMVDLCKTFLADPVEQGTDVRTVFRNIGQRRIAVDDAGRPTAGPLRFWHSPGREFAYRGYDPNSGMRYVNLFHWNALGYFDHDYPQAKSRSVSRIIFIGDSYVEAVQVPLERTFHKLVEAGLNEAGPGMDGGPRIEVIALGSSGTGQVEHLRVLRDRAVRFDPDVVVFALCSNDFCDDDPILKQELVLAAGCVTPPVRRLAARGFMATAFAIRRFEDIQRNKVGVAPELLQWSADDIPRIEAAWDRTLGSVRAARDFCRSRGVGFALVYLGAELEVKYRLDPASTLAGLRAMGGLHRDISWDMDKSVRRVNAFCDRHDITLISLLEPLVQAQEASGKYVFGDHYTFFGHEVAAQVLNRSLGMRFHAQLASRPVVRQAVASEEIRNPQPARPTEW